MVRNFIFIPQIKIIRNGLIEKNYSFANLPEKYFSLYLYAKKIINILNKKDEKQIIVTQNEKFVIKKSLFEAHYNDGNSVIYDKNLNLMRI